MPTLHSRCRHAITEGHPDDPETPHIQTWPVLLVQGEWPNVPWAIARGSMADVGIAYTV